MVTEGIKESNDIPFMFCGEDFLKNLKFYAFFDTFTVKALQAKIA